LQTFSLDIARLNLPCTTGYARSSIQRRFSVWALHLRLKKREAKECLERLTNNGSCDVEPDNPSHASRRLPAWKRKLPNRVRVGTCLTFVLLLPSDPVVLYSSAASTLAINSSGAGLAKTSFGHVRQNVTIRDRGLALSRFVILRVFSDDNSRTCECASPAIISSRVRTTNLFIGRNYARVGKR
jgi:hypothetical protein